jgi:nucleotide-binding universal stress UspA family protein
VSTIVVGVDGSDEADEALRVAAREAKAKLATLRIVSAWHVPGYAYGGVGATPIVSVRDAFKEEATTAVASAIEKLGDEAEGIDISRVIREGRAATVLADEARDADLLVVGSRGLGGFAGLLLGSVSQELAHHSPSSVLIVRRPPDRR